MTFDISMMIIGTFFPHISPVTSASEAIALKNRRVILPNLVGSTSYCYFDDNGTI
ncbi:MAG: hypothetical protein QNJ72_06400 [Pleurocapsa sp. MO_226.B13]|nr:hypothetical protein [Pleurocapsa sp. MO_226.B13]